MRTMLFNPYTGRPRDPRDIASDPAGKLMMDPDEPVLAAPRPPAGVVQVCPDCDIADCRHIRPARAPQISEGVRYSSDARQ